jgi:hypothetical protein
MNVRCDESSAQITLSKVYGIHNSLENPNAQGAVAGGTEQMSGETFEYELRI